MKISKAQRDALDKINAARNNWRRKFYAEILPTLTGEFAHATPSEWVSVETLCHTHHVRYATVRALARNGLIERRYGGIGQGDEVRIIAPAFIWTLDAAEELV
jgi:hypothetical protein